MPLGPEGNEPLVDRCWLRRLVRIVKATRQVTNPNAMLRSGEGITNIWIVRGVEREPSIGFL